MLSTKMEANLDLKHYLFFENVRQADLAKTLGCNCVTVSQITQGKRPSRHLALAIEYVTKGKVTVEELLNPEKASKWIEVKQ